jgi:hypothetical protein
MSRPYKSQKTGKTWPVCGRNWVRNRQVTPPRKSAIYENQWSNTTSGIMSINAPISFPGTTFGDWYDAYYFGKWASVIQATLYLSIIRGTESSATSSISVDPTFSAVETITGVPEPSSLVLSGLAILCGVAYAARVLIRSWTSSRSQPLREKSPPHPGHGL